MIQIALTVNEVEAWLESKHTTLWQDFNLHDPVQRRKAAEWFVSEQLAARQFTFPEETVWSHHGIEIRPSNSLEVAVKQELEALQNA